MSSTYNGSSSATQAPSDPPDIDAQPKATLPADGDDLVAASVAQSMKRAADFETFMTQVESFGPWRWNGTDTTISVNTLLSGAGHRYYRDLTIQTGVQLTIQDPGIIFCRKLIVQGTGQIIIGNKSGALNGNAGVSIVGGAGGVGWNAGLAPFNLGGPIMGGGSGGVGGYLGHLAPGAGIGTSYSVGGGGGAGGNGQHAGGAAGVADGSLLLATVTSLLQVLMNEGIGYSGGGTESARTVAPFWLMGGAGGGGGGGTNGASGTAGGGGGAGGGLGIIIARHINVAADGAIVVPGGNGGAGFSTGGEATGGGGAGGGGGVALIWAKREGATLTAGNCCPAGSAGAGSNGGANGAAGGAGTITEIQVGW